ncbi:hypothetical protein J6590_043539 [Homalodisca vitripennis]|nr:hypothetical protein J6590_043539 [Homalodisca vitripennis]
MFITTKFSLASIPIFEATRQHSSITYLQVQMQLDEQMDSSSGEESSPITVWPLYPPPKNQLRSRCRL